MKQFYKNCLSVLLTILSTLVLANSSFAACNPNGDQVTYGTNNKWIGYVYQGVNFNTYFGRIQEGNGSSPNFDENFDGSQVYFKTNGGCDIYTDTFSVRLKLTKNFSNGYYEFIVGGDDGYRLSIDGGNTWIIDRWNDQSYSTYSYTVQLNGTYNLVLEYYERFGDNRLSFSVGTGCTPTGNPSVTGTANVWRGYLYQGTNFQSYRGAITRGSANNPNFDENFGGANVNFATGSCSLPTENFSARFRLQLNLSPGTYVFTVGADDGYRFSLDGGNTWVINNWTTHSYTTSSYVTQLNGVTNMVIEYFESGGDNRLSFAMSNNSSLPVKLTGFTAKATASDKVQLDWKVSQEQNFSHYIVQRSMGGEAFKDVAVVAGQETNTNTPVSYRHTDAVQFSGLVHYRLAMLDKDGTIDYSPTVTVSLNMAAGTVKIYPTIVENGNLYIVTDNLKQGKIEVYDMNGRLMLSKNNLNGGYQRVPLNNNHIAAGTYMVRVSEGNKQIAGKMVILK